MRRLRGGALDRPAPPQPARLTGDGVDCERWIERAIEKCLVATRAERVRELAGTIDVLVLIEEVEAFRDEELPRVQSRLRGPESNL